MIYLAYYFVGVVIATILVLMLAYSNQSPGWKHDKPKTLFIAVIGGGLIWPLWAAAFIYTMVDLLKEIIHEVTRP